MAALSVGLGVCPNNDTQEKATLIKCFCIMFLQYTFTYDIVNGKMSYCIGNFYGKEKRFNKANLV